MDARAATGCLLGTAVGDSLGLPYEGLSARRAARMFGDPMRHHLLPGHGMVSDDTEHACFTARALLLAGDDVDKFGRLLAASLRWWFLGLPAGIGLATLRAIVKSCIGFPPDKSGVFSAGNGPAMRSAIIGVAWGHDPEKMKAFVRRSTCITHTDPKACDGALAVALAAHWAETCAPMSPEAFINKLAALGVGEETVTLARHAAKASAAKEAVGIFAAALGSRGGISGYMLHTVPCVLHVWFRHPDDISAGLREIIGAGGDTDTTAAIYGGIVGARVGKQGIPADALRGIADWPRSVTWVERLGDALATQGKCPGYFVPGIPVRNALFMAIVLAHGFRRLVPPY
ncbi:ADP-ribosylglycohydrolase family protein [Ramlibacter albus]|uniref:ADP-ribosylglycohydrolase family protein n=1 Tax=Ramlibacter albus TaxID=2079448 RepID=A0A923S1Z8_9BURK|nr:ADP-ribosylglycohydrolase family protein [Ramlibacter albus]MBC5764228.1 ADP-ribosylglycohydrolase family protein [Ramlibacter albus]